MTEDHRDLNFRLIVTGVGADGKSTFESDGPSPDRVVGEGFTRNNMWGASQVPTPVMAPNYLVEKGSFLPPLNGYGYDITAFAPDSQWDYEAGYARLLKNSGIEPHPDDAPGMHVTDTVDIVTVISGEVFVLVDTGEKFMTKGDTIVIRGVKHAWSNRSDGPCIISALHVNVTR